MDHPVYLLLNVVRNTYSYTFIILLCECVHKRPAYIILYICNGIPINTAAAATTYRLCYNACTPRAAAAAGFSRTASCGGPGVDGP